MTQAYAVYRLLSDNIVTSVAHRIKVIFGFEFVIDLTAVFVS